MKNNIPSGEGKIPFGQNEKEEIISIAKTCKILLQGKKNAASTFLFTSVCRLVTVVSWRDQLNFLALFFI